MSIDQPTILVTGAGGQLGKELQQLAHGFAGYRFLFADKTILNIGDAAATAAYFAEHAIKFCINCAAYTAVDKAESEQASAFLINADAVANLATQCCKYQAQLIHISTDYVFDGTSTRPYQETDKTNPVSIYGKSKLLGEELALQHCPTSIIIRTAWLYSAFNANFVKTMLRLMSEKESIQVVNDQYGCPTYAADLASAVLQIIASGKSKQYPGIYHYSNTGITNWHGFALAIKKIAGSNCIVNPIATAQFPTAAKRPAYSVLDTAKIRETFHLNIPDWKNSLQRCLALLT